MEMVIKATEAIICQYISVSTRHIVHLKAYTMSYVSYISIKNMVPKIQIEGHM